MGAAIAPALVPPSLQALLAGAPEGAETLPVMLASLPSSLASTSRPIALSGTLLGLLENGELALRTAAGQLTLSVNATQSDTLNKLLASLGEANSASKTVDLVIQPGSPPKTGLLIFTKSETPRMAAPLPDAAMPTTTLPTAPRLNADALIGTKLNVTVLPDGIEKNILAPEFKTVLHGMAKDSPFPALKTLENLSLSVSLLAKKVIAQTTNAALEIKNEPHDQAAPLAFRTGTATTTAQDARLTLDKVVQPDADWPAALGDTQVRAVVIGKTLSGQTLIHVEDKTLVVREKLDLPTGTRLVATLTPASEARDEMVIPLSNDQDFLAVRELVAALKQSDPAAAAAFLQTRLPTPAHHLSGTVMFFLAALQAGKIDEWLAPAALALRFGDKKNLAEKVETALREASGAARDAQVGEWRSYPIPLHAGQSFEMLNLYVHRDASGGGHATEGATEQAKRTRFLISMNMSRLGPMQIDGLSNRKSLDLVVRSERKLADDFTNDVRATALRTFDATGLTGSIVFQSGRQNWVTFESAAPPQTKMA